MDRFVHLKCLASSSKRVYFFHYWCPTPFLGADWLNVMKIICICIRMVLLATKHKIHIVRAWEISGPYVPSYWYLTQRDSESGTGIIHKVLFITQKTEVVFFTPLYLTYIFTFFWTFPIMIYITGFISLLV